MKKPPFPVIIVSVLFILVGCIGFAYHAGELFDSSISIYQTLWILFLEIVALGCGVLLLFRINWARWLLVGWLIYHVFVSALHSTSQLIAHIAFLIIFSILLFLPKSSAYFQNKQKVQES